METAGTAATTAESTYEQRRSRIDAGFARFYAPFAVLTFALTFFPYFTPQADDVEPFGGLWQEVARTGHPDDVMAVMAFLVVITLLVVAGLEKLGTVGLFAAAFFTMLIASLLLGRPGYSEKPPLSSAGIADAALCFVGMLILIVHVGIRLGLSRRRSSGRPAPRPPTAS